ncbi:NAD(P)-dependent dehydrogenase, short-chain alcohol dehydrogenase family [Saccharopolyspora kobensis]|uniref:NAD(P)-dependent dehydrogenase, short-chain alcohol dehydrogenase family n=1 Tax=Saccharopolyspora kobensis TaxID=146035 RepID=A0A1H5UXQ3_9PSEU|nr:SDR family NAD(P)-dependent oxidoreductase [Saccharopolyspora kobensis]SEF79806.1 NAD(P)-dependent dehydrogenase, short-chain alcohol dehydrogenase family [Saccharopolyspora kobensis]SFC67726.1 NAD(P)-dependent dehydrogenase, short-chain alcohol dehydrogenase family [Saccharopolyspora kobensis]
MTGPMGIDLAGKNAVVTGASRGIGLAVVRELVSCGARVLGGARAPSPALSEATPHVLAVDLATSDGPARLVEHAIGEFGGIDVLINNVSGSESQDGGFLDVSEESWHREFEATFFSAVRATRAGLSSLVERRGSVVMVGSVHSRLPLPGVVAYSAAKSALASVTKALSEEFAPQGVRVNSVSPGLVRTAVWTGPDSEGAKLARQYGVSQEELLAGLPAQAGVTTGVFSEPEEIARLIVLVASGVLPNLTGAEIVLDGGMIKTL